ncbi:MAG: hypothetical protein H6719_30625 [Sandaracinaceae bacterium]|nr:hypothetical protein [Sandaracinaceae bacterium]
MLRRFTPFIACLALASAALAQDGECPEATFQPRLLTPPALRIPRDAALVVGLVDGGTFQDLPPVSLTRGRRDMALTREPIAPGLFRLRPSSSRIYGQWQLTGVPGATPLVFARSALDPVPIAPQLARVEQYLVASGAGSRTEVRAHFQFPIPEGVVAAVVFWGDDPQPDGFVPTVATAQELVVYSRTGDCAHLPAGGSGPPDEGDVAVRVAFVGRYGALSPRSEPAPLTR